MSHWMKSDQTRTNGPLNSKVETKGYVLHHTDTGQSWLCSQLAESYPPQCAGEVVELIQLNIALVTVFNKEQGVIWTPERVLVTGRRSQDGILVDSIE